MKNKIGLFAGLSLFACFCLLVGSGVLATRFGGGAWLMALGETVSFVLPTLLLLAVTPQNVKTLQSRLRLRRLPRGAVGLSVKLGLTVAVLSLFLNFLIYQLAGLTGASLSATALDAPQSGLNAFGRIAVIVLLSAVVEEMFLRGALFAAHERLAGTGACIIVSGVAFAMLHGNLMNFAGPMLAGIAYAYLTYCFDSIWPAVLAHAVNNIYYLFVVWVTETYAAFGIWKYFAALNLIALLLFLYLSLRSAERLLAEGRIPRLKKGAARSGVFSLLRNPGALAFIAAFAVKAVLHWI